LFIDELHTLVGAGAAEGAIDAASILKPMLARGELQTVGATTLDEYRKYVEKDAALERRFQPVRVGEPSVEQTMLGARPLRRTIQREIEDQLSEKILFGQVQPGQIVVVDVAGWDGEGAGEDATFTFRGEAKPASVPDAPPIDLAKATETGGTGPESAP